MKIGLIGHASIAVSSSQVKCIMDPVLINPFEAGTTTFFPQIKINIEDLKKECNLIIISHSHMDHFCVQSLALLSKKIPVIFPAKDKLIKNALKKLGYSNCYPVTAGDRVKFGDIEIFATPSQVNFPEVGIIFRSNEKTFWNMVDTVVDDSAISDIRQIYPYIDLLFAKYQPLIEEQLVLNSLGADFPFQRYGRLLKGVSAIKPRAVVAGSCGYRFLSDDWLNLRGFPVSRKRFLCDVAKIDPSIIPIDLTHGGTIDLDHNFATDEKGLDFIDRIEEENGQYQWRPDKGVPPLNDLNRFKYPFSVIKKNLNDFLYELPSKLMKIDLFWLEKMQTNQVKWLLEIIFPNGVIEKWYLDLSTTPLAWNANETDDADLITSICASTIVALLKADCNSYSVYFNQMRVVNRLYAVHANGISTVGDLSDEPITKCLLRNADTRYVRKLTRLFSKKFENCISS